MTVESGIRPRHRRGLSVRVSPLAVAIAATLSVGSFSASAQQQGGGLEEIVVTARYREENIQTTPISISAFSAEELEVRSIENVADIGQAIPNAYFRRNMSNFGPNNTIGMRGLNQVRLQLRVRAHGRRLHRRRLPQHDHGLRHGPRRSRARRGAARPARHAVRQEQHRRRDSADLEEAAGRQHRHRAGHAAATTIAWT